MLPMVQLAAVPQVAVQVEPEASSPQQASTMACLAATIQMVVVAEAVAQVTLAAPTLVAGRAARVAIPVAAVVQVLATLD